MGIHSDSALAQAYSLIETANPSQARVILEEAITSDIDNAELVFAIKSCTFWAQAMEERGNRDSYEYGELLVNRWQKYTVIIDHEEESYDRTVYSFRKGVFSLALEQYQNASDQHDEQLHAELSRKQGLCYKRLGSYEKALDCLADACKIHEPSAPLIAELADCYDLCGETARAKLLFREAFFVDAQKVDLEFLDSPLISVVVEHVKKEGYTGAALQEWIPVYGVLIHVLDKKRELRAVEVGRLKQEIFARENELKDPANSEELIKPRLMNLYFWLIDHITASKEPLSKMNEVLLKIKQLDQEIHAQYVK